MRWGRINGLGICRVDERRQAMMLDLEGGRDVLEGARHRERVGGE